MNDLPNPVIDEEAEALLNAAHEEDHKPFVDSDENPSPEPAVEPVASELELEENEPTEAELADPANKDRARDPVSGKFIKKPAEATPQAAVPVVADASKTTPESEYAAKQRERKEKDAARLEKTWENVNARKEELDRRQAEIEEQRRQFSQPQPQKQVPQPREFSSKQLLEASDDFKRNAREAFKRYQESGNEADLDEFNKNDQLAEQAFQNAGEFYAVEQQEAQQGAMEQHNKTWVANMEAAIKDNPDLGKPESPIAKQMLDLLKTHGAVFQMLPDGFKQAEAIAKLRLDAAETPSLREKLTKAGVEIGRLTALTSLSKGGPTGGPAAEKSFDSLSLEEQGNRLRQLAEQADEG